MGSNSRLGENYIIKRIGESNIIKKILKEADPEIDLTHIPKEHLAAVKNSIHNIKKASSNASNYL
jgi:hypothetical protein